jgi:UrcA family protein
MNTHSILSILAGPLSRRTAFESAIVMALVATAPVCAIADQRAAPTTVSGVAEVSLSDLDLSTPEGVRLARERLHTMAERICADRGGGSDPLTQPAFSACVDSTVANALRHIEALRQTHVRVRNSVTLGASVSLADLDLSTMEGARSARQRLEAMARRLCDELARRQDVSYQLNYAACLHDTVAGALAQADALAAARNARTARRNSP